MLQKFNGKHESMLKISNFLMNFRNYLFALSVWYSAAFFKPRSVSPHQYDPFFPHFACFFTCMYERKESIKKHGVMRVLK